MQVAAFEVHVGEPQARRVRARGLDRAGHEIDAGDLARAHARECERQRAGAASHVEVALRWIGTEPATEAPHQLVQLRHLRFEGLCAGPAGARVERFLGGEGSHPT